MMDLAILHSDIKSSAGSSRLGNGAGRPAEKEHGGVKTLMLLRFE